MGNKKEIIKVGYLLSYDYKYTITSIQLLYKHVDKIVISYDLNNKTWAGNEVCIPNPFFDKLKELDTEGKIVLYPDVFYISGKSTMELETRQRNMMAEKMGLDGWHIQIDGDEYGYDFEKISSFLRKNTFLLKKAENFKINFQVNLVTLFKQDEDGYYVIAPFTEKCMMITNYPEYQYARRTNQGRTLALDFYLIHQSWAREEYEISEKIKNWGHKNDFDTALFFEEWKALNKDNYLDFTDFHPLDATQWKKLVFYPAKNIEEFITSFAKMNPQLDLQLELSWTKKLKLRIKNLLS